MKKQLVGRTIQYRWRLPGQPFNKWQRWGVYPTTEVRDLMLDSRRAKYSWTDRFEFRAA